MVRFARAKGSKASNERVPEKATSWAEMKQQLVMKNQEIEENKKRQDVNNQRNANYRAFLAEREENERKNATWADFPGVVPFEKKNKVKKKAKSNKKSNGININIDIDDVSEDDEEFDNLKKKVDQALIDMKKNSYTDDAETVDDSVSPKKTLKRKKAQAVKKTPAINNSVEKAFTDEHDTIGSDPDIIHKVSHSVSPKKKLKKKKAQATKNSRAIQNSGEKATAAIVDVDSNKIDSDSDAPPDEESAKKEIPKPIIKIKKPKQKKLKIIDGKEERGVINKRVKKKRKLSESDETTSKKKVKIEGKAKGKQTRDKDNKKVIKENLTEKDLKKIEKKKQKRLKQVLKKKRIKEELKKQKEESGEQEAANESNDAKTKIIDSINTNKKPNGFKEKFDKRSNNINMKTKKERVIDKEERPRKKPLLPHKMFINGKELDIEYLDGFPVKREDAERIKKLRKEMISKGLPRSEINVSLKLERRKAEKALAREKKKVCFNCRKSGHNLSECPDLNKDQVAHTAGSGICFKCGSTEHTHFECRVVRGQEFKFAQCFICNEQGHIARQCPDNARGLYPKGGACRVCGDVTHLKKDCPTYQAQQQRQESNLKLETFGDSNPDVLEENSGNGKQSTEKRPNKIIKF